MMLSLLFHIAEVVSLQTFLFKSRRFSVPMNHRLSIALTSFSVTAGLAAAVVPAPLAIAQPFFFSRDNQYTPSTRDYDRCTARLLDLKLPAEEAASACARALKPSDLSRCVTRVSDVKGIAATDALEACRRVWRPQEMASCVVDIEGRVNGSTATEVLDYCRRSLLPDRFANCVVGVSRAVKSSPTQALDTCIDGGYFPREVDPTFIPYPLTSSEPTIPSVAEPVPAPAPVVPAPVTPTTPAPPSEVTPQRF